MFEWDQAKRLRIVLKRGLDFRDAGQIFDGRPVIHIASWRNDEDRFVSTAEIHGKLYTVVWMWREHNQRIYLVREGERWRRKGVS
jgi:uncharacterized protein